MRNEPGRYSAIAYFREIATVGAAVQATNARGEPISTDQGVNQTLALLDTARTSGSKVLLIANGGSAAIVSHMQNDLCKAVGIRALVFNEAPLLTALSNDEGYAHAFERCVALWADRSDVLIAIGSSGQSQNILLGVRAARARNATVVTLSGFAPDNPLRSLGDVNFYAPSNSYGIVELTHQTLAHLLTDRSLAAAKSADGGR